MRNSSGTLTTSLNRVWTWEEPWGHPESIISGKLTLFLSRVCTESKSHGEHSDESYQDTPGYSTDIEGVLQNHPAVSQNVLNTVGTCCTWHGMSWVGSGHEYHSTAHIPGR